jgi:TP901 family phage tail tape measure protein
LAQTTTQAKLGLLISAKDEASKVFSEFAKNIKADMENVQKYIKDGLKMDAVTKGVQDDTKKIIESFNNVETAIKDLKGQNFAEKMVEQMKQIRTEANTMASGVNKDFKSISTEAGTLSTHISSMHASFKFGDMMDAGMQLQQTGEKMLGFFESAVESGAEFDQSIKNATSSLDAQGNKADLTSGQIAALSKTALDMGKDGFFSANQIADAINTMAKAGINYNTIMGGGIDVVKKVAAANQQDLEKTATTVSDIYNEMSESFSKVSTQDAAQQIGNSMTVALHHARISMDDFLNTMKYVGPNASQAGWSIKDVSAAIAVLGQHGIKGSQAGTTLRRMLTNLTPASKPAADMMKKLGMITADGGNIFYTSSGKMKSMVQVQKLLHDHISGLTPQMQTLAIKTIFGQYALSGMGAIIGTNNQKFKDLTKEMKNNAEMDQILATKKQGLMMKIQGVNAHFQTMMKEIGIMLIPVVTKLLGLATKLMNAWDHLGTPIKKAIVIFGAVSSIMMVVGGTILTCIGLFGMFVGSFGHAITGLMRIGSVLRMMSPPILIAIGVIAALAYAWKHNIGGIQQIVHKFVSWFKPIFGHTFATAKKDVTEALSKITAGFHGWNKNIMVPINKGVNFILHSFVNGLKTLTKAVSSGITTVTHWFNKMAPDINKALHNIMAFFTKHSNTWKALWKVFSFIVKVAWDWIAGIFKHAWGLISGIIQLFVHIINGQWKKVFHDLWQIVKNALLLALDLWGGFAGKAFGWIGRIIARTGIFGKAFSKIFSGMFKLVEKIFSAGFKYAEGIVKAAFKVIEPILKLFSKVVETVFKAVVKFIQSHSQAAMNVFKKIFTSLVHVGKTLLKGLEIEIKAIFGWIKSLFNREPAAWMTKLKTAFTNGVNAVKSTLSKWWTAIKGIFSTLGKWIKEDVKAVLSVFKKDWDGATTWVKGIISKFGNAVKSLFTSIKSHIEGPIKTVLSWLKKIFQSEINGVKAILNGLKNIVTSIFTAVKNLITGHAGKAMSALKTAFTAGINTAKAVLRGILGVVDAVLGGLPSKFLSKAKNGIGNLISGFRNGVGQVKGALSGIGSAIDGALGGLPGKMLKWAGNAVSMFASGIKAGIGKIASAASAIGNKIKSLVGFHSPTKEGPMKKGESDQWMPNMMKMFAQGIDDNRDKIKKSVEGIGVDIKTSVSETDMRKQFVEQAKKAADAAKLKHVQELQAQKEGSQQGTSTSPDDKRKKMLELEKAQHDAMLAKLKQHHANVIKAFEMTRKAHEMAMAKAHQQQHDKMVALQKEKQKMHEAMLAKAKQHFEEIKRAFAAKKAAHEVAVRKEQQQKLVAEKSDVKTAVLAHHTNKQPVINITINVEGRSKQTDRQLLDELARQFRTQMSMVLT